MSHPHHASHHSNIPLLTCALLAALTTGGPTYAFGLYGGDLKESLQLTQSQLDTISSSNFCAGLLSWIPGLMVDKFGVRFSLSLGGTLGAGFMTLYWAVARQFIRLEPDAVLPALCALGVFVFMTNGLVIGSIFKLLVSTCAPHTKGSAVGAAKGYVGLGSGVYACLFRALKTPQISNLDFLPLAAVLAVLAGTLPALLLLPSKREMDRILQSTPTLKLDQTTALHLRVVYGGLVVLALIVVGTSLASLMEDKYYEIVGSEVMDIPETTQHYGRAILILFAWIGPIMTLLFLPTKSTKLHDGPSHQNENDNPELVESLCYTSSSEDEDDEEGLCRLPEQKPLIKNASSSALAYGAEITASVQATGPRGLLGQKALTVTMRQEVPDLTLQQMLQTLPAWLFVWISIIKVGGGTMITNNMGQMVESLYFPLSTTTPAALALFSVAQGVSRVVTGAVSDAALSWNRHQTLHWGGGTYNLRGVPRPAFLVVSCLGGVVAHIFLSLTTSRGYFLLGVCFAGAAFGMIWPLMVLIVGEVFGTANMGANYMFFDGLSSALGTLLLSKFVTQEVYERHLPDEQQRTCYGQDCFFGAHIIVAVLSFTAVAASYWFYHTTRHVYAKRSVDPLLECFSN